MQTYCAFDATTHKFISSYQAESPRPELTPLTGRKVLHVILEDLSILEREALPRLLISDGVMTVV